MANMQDWKLGDLGAVPHPTCDLLPKLRQDTSHFSVPLLPFPCLFRQECLWEMTVTPSLYSP